MKSLLAVSYSLILTLIIAPTVQSNNAPESKKILIEINDKFDEVKIGVTESTVFMIFSEKVKNFANNAFGVQHQANLQAFEDSDGNFIRGFNINLKSNRIEINKEDISEIVFKNGRINFIYHTKPKIGFEDIYSINGTKALENFYVEDLEKFILTYSNS